MVFPCWILNHGRENLEKSFPSQSICRKMELTKEWCNPALHSSQHPQVRFLNIIKDLGWSGKTGEDFYKYLQKIHKMMTKASHIWNLYPPTRTGLGKLWPLKNPSHWKNECPNKPQSPSRFPCTFKTTLVPSTYTSIFFFPEDDRISSMKLSV